MGAPLRVAVWSTGGIGSIAIETIARRTDLELVGVWVHSPEKVGRDAGELANGVPIGLAATNDVDAILALRPDCVVYAASSPERDAAMVPATTHILESGVNVVSTTATGAIYPPAYDPRWREPLDAAARKGGVTFYASGIEPGFAADQLPLILATQSSDIRSIRASELALYDDYPVTGVMMDGLGFGRPLDFPAMIGTPGAILASWAGPVRFIAESLGVELDTIREEFDRAPTDRTLEVAFGTVEAGTCGALWIKAVGVVDGEDAIVVEHVTRLVRDTAPDWPIGDFDITYRVEIEGDPNISNDMGFTVDDAARLGIGSMTSGAGAMVATAMRVVNAIPFVVDAPPGLVSSLDLPLTVPRTAFRMPR